MGTGVSNASGASERSVRIAAAVVQSPTQTQSSPGLVGATTGSTGALPWIGPPPSSPAPQLATNTGGACPSPIAADGVPRRRPAIPSPAQDASISPSTTPTAAAAALVGRRASDDRVAQHSPSAWSSPLTTTVMWEVDESATVDGPDMLRRWTSLPKATADRLEDAYVTARSQTRRHDPSDQTESSTGGYKAAPSFAAASSSPSSPEGPSPLNIAINKRIYHVDLTTLIATRQGGGGASAACLCLRRRLTEGATPLRLPGGLPAPIEDVGGTSSGMGPVQPSHATGRTNQVTTSFDPQAAEASLHMGTGSTSRNEFVASAPGIPTSAQLTATAEAHDNLIYCAAFSTDGTCLITGSRDGSAKVWEVDTGYVVAAMPPIQGMVLSCAFQRASPKTFAVGSDDCLFRICRTRESSENRVPPIVVGGHTGKVYGLSFTSNDKHVVSGSMDHTLRVTDANTLQCTNVLRGHTASVFAVCASPFSPFMVVSGGDDNQAVRYDLRQGGSIVHTLKGHTKTIWTVDVRFDELMIASSGMDGRVLLWDMRSPNQPLLGGQHAASVHAVEFMPDGGRLLSAARDGTWRIWNAAVEQRASSIGGSSLLPPVRPLNVVAEVDGGVSAAADDGTADAAAVSQSSIVGLLPPSGGASGMRELRVLAHEGFNVFRVSYNQMRDVVMSCGSDSKIKLWKLKYH